MAQLILVNKVKYVKNSELKQKTPCNAGKCILWNKRHSLPKTKKKMEIRRKWEYCSKIYISDEGMAKHLKIKHPEKIKLYSCFTWKQFSSTVLHQLNCQRFQGADSQIENITHWLEIYDSERYYIYIHIIDLWSFHSFGISVAAHCI